MRILKWLSCGLVMAMLATPAYAMCKKSDMAGDYVLSGTAEDELGTLAMVCALRIRKNGKLRIGQFCAVQELSGNSFPTSVNDGRLRVNKSCFVTGTVVISGFVLNVVSGAMTLNKEQFSGIMAGENFLFEFTAIRVEP